VTFALSFVLCFLLTDKAVRFAVEHNTTLQLADALPCIWRHGCLERRFWTLNFKKQLKFKK
jgi:hypothetical protein